MSYLYRIARKRCLVFQVFPTEDVKVNKWFSWEPSPERIKRYWWFTQVSLLTNNKHLYWTLILVMELLHDYSEHNYFFQKPTNLYPFILIMNSLWVNWDKFLCPFMVQSWHHAYISNVRVYLLSTKYRPNWWHAVFYAHLEYTNKYSELQ